MATTKHLDPTNVDISIPAMTDQPNASVFSNCVDKEADAINALNDKMRNLTVRSFGNANSIVVDIGFTPSQNTYGHVLVFNANRMVFGMILPATSGASYINLSGGTTTFTLSISGSTLTITPSATLWGLTTLLIDHN